MLTIRNDGTNSAGGLSCTTPQTPTLTAVSAQTEREKVSRNAGLALEFRGRREEESKEDYTKLSRFIHRRDNAAPLILIPPQQSDCNNYYNISQQTSTNSENSFMRSNSLAEKNPVLEEEYCSRISCSEDESEIKAYNSNEASSQNGFDSEDSANNEQPIDLSNKSTPYLGPFVQNTFSTSNFALFSPFDSSSTERALSNPISDVLTPVSEPATLIASLCSSVERCPVSTSLLADQQIPTPTDPTEANMLHAYLKECAVQNFRMRLLQRKNSGTNETPVVTSSCAEILSSASSVADTTELMIDGQYSENEMLPTLQQVESDMKEPLMHSAFFTDSTNVKTNSNRNLIIADSKKMNICNSGTPVKAQVSESSESKGNGESGNDETKDAARMKSPFYMDCGMPNIPLVRCDTVVRNGISSYSLISSPTLNAATVSPTKSPSGTAKAEFMSPSTGPSPVYFSLTEDGRSMCNVCNKVFSNPSHLRLHVNIHYFERPFRCDSCAVSFRTKGHLQKHERSVSHQNKVSMNSTFGTPTTTNPRPFKCDDCIIAFRMHGHLAKHLRSKMHIMKLECIGKLPFGTCAQMEREGFNPNDVDTTDYENSLEFYREMYESCHGSVCVKQHCVENMYNYKSYNSTKPATYWIYLDDKNLYGWAIVLPLPSWKFNHINLDGLQKHNLSPEFGGYYLIVSPERTQKLYLSCGAIFQKGEQMSLDISAFDVCIDTAGIQSTSAAANVNK